MNENDPKQVQQTPKTSVGPERNPKTLEEAEWFHQGVLYGLTIYARESGASTLKSENPLLCRLLDEERWRAIESYEAAEKPDWRIGLSCKPKMRSHELYYERGEIVAVHPSGTHGIVDANDVLQIKMQSGRVFLAPAEDWMTA